MHGAMRMDRLVHLFAQSRFDDVLTETAMLMTQTPLTADLHQLRALAKSRIHGAESATDDYRRALVTAPGHYFCYYNFANCLRTLGRPGQAKCNYGRAVAITPRLPEAFNNLGLLQQEDGDDDAAADSFRQAIRGDGLCHAYRKNIAKLLLRQARHGDAAAACRRALLLEPSSADAWTTLGLVLDMQTDYAAAQRCNRRALSANPGLAVARSNAALIDLRLGRFAQGWDGYAARKQPTIEVRNPDGLPLPPWHGGSPAGRRLLLWCEQGIGDQIMFLSLLPHLLRAGAKVAVVIEDRMLALVRRSFPEVEVIPERQMVAERRLASPADAWTFLGDLPRHLALFCGGTARPEPWLVPDPDRAAALRQSLQARHPGRRLVGITWRSISPVDGGLRSIAPELWSPVLAVPGCAFVSLQYGATAADGEAFLSATGQCPDIDHGIEPLVDLDGLAALVAAIDLAVCPVNNTVHFAGAMGRPGWTLLPRRPDWRWGLGTTRSPWYPSLTLFRRDAGDDWTPVMAAVARDLAAWAVSRSAG